MQQWLELLLVEQDDLGSNPALSQCYCALLGHKEEVGKNDTTTFRGKSICGTSVCGTHELEDFQRQRTKVKNEKLT